MKFDLKDVPSKTLKEHLEGGLFTDGDWVESKDQDPTGDVRLIQLADVGDGVFRNRSQRFLTMQRAQELGCTFLEPGDVLVARMPEPLGRSCVFPGVGQPAVTAVDVCILRPNPTRVSVGWLTKSINSPDFRQSMQHLVRGTTRQRISRKNLGTLQLPVIELEKQILVSEFVDQLDVKRTTATIHLARARRAIERFRQSVLAAACSGRLTADWREKAQLEDLDLALEKLRFEQSSTGRRATENVIRGIGNLAVGHPGAEAPPGWKWVPLTRVARLESGHTPSRKHPEYWGGDIPWIGIQDAREHHAERLSDTRQHTNELGLEHSSARLLPANTVCMSRTASVGYVVIMDRPMATSQDFVNWICSEALVPEFLMFSILAEGDGIRRFGRGTTHTTIYFPEVKALNICLPPLAEQQEIVRSTAQLLSRVDGLEEKLTSAESKVRRISQAVLAKAFRGERVSPMSVNRVSKDAPTS